MSRVDRLVRKLPPGDLTRREHEELARLLAKVEAMSIAGAAASGNPTVPLIPQPPGNPLYFRVRGETNDANLWGGADLIVYSDSGTTEKARIDGATGKYAISNLATDGSIVEVDGTYIISIDTSETTFKFTHGIYIQDGEFGLHVADPSSIFHVNMDSGTNDFALFSLPYGTDNSSAQEVLRLDRTYSAGAGAAGIGTKQTFWSEDDGGTAKQMGEIITTFTTVSAGSEAANMRFDVMGSGSLVQTLDISPNTATVTGTLAATTVTGANVTSGADPGHTHTGGSIGSIDISDDTNLAVTAPIVLTDDTLSHSGADGYVHVPSGGSSAQILQYSSAGTAKWVTLSNDATIADGGAITIDHGNLDGLSDDDHTQYFLLAGETTKPLVNITYTEATAGEQAFKITATDSVVQSAGMLQTLLVDHNISAAKSGTASSEGVSVDMSLGANIQSAYAFASYVSQTGNPNISLVEGMNIYLEDMGSGTLDNVIGLDIGINSTNTGDSRHAGVRIRNHSGTAKAAIMIEETFTDTILRHSPSGVDLNLITLDNSSGAILKWDDSESALSWNKNLIISGTHDATIIDVTSTEALLVRKDTDGGDVFTVDTTNSYVYSAGGIAIGSTAPSDRSIYISHTISASSYLFALDFRPTLTSSSQNIYGLYINPTVTIPNARKFSGLSIIPQSITVSAGTGDGYWGVAVYDPVSVTGTYNYSYGVDIANMTSGTYNFAIRTGTGIHQFGDYLTIDQSSSTGAKPVLTLDQGDASEQAIKISYDAADVDMILLDLDVTGSPQLGWDESEDTFTFSKGVDITGNTTYIGAPITLTLKSTDTSIGQDDVVGRLDFYTSDNSANCAGIGASIIAMGGDTYGEETDLVFYTAFQPGATPAVERLRIEGKTGSMTIPGLITITSADGLDITPGSDTDTQLITLNVTGTPRIWWDESEDLFATTKGILLGGASPTNASAGDLMLAYDSAIKSSTGAANWYGKYVPFTGSGHSEISNYYASGEIQFYISGGTSGNHVQALKIDQNGELIGDMNLKLLERSAAFADAATYGQLWVKDDDPNVLMYTDGDGADFTVDVTPV